MRKFTYVVAGAALAALVAAPAFAGEGNGKPTGGKYNFNLQIKAFENCPGGDFTGSERHQIAVKADFQNDQEGNHKSTLVKQNTIKLEQSPDDKFHVTDGMACNDDNGPNGGAVFELPITVDNLDCDGTTQECIDDPDFVEYRVVARLVGGGSQADITTCATELDNSDFDNDGVEEEIVCSLETAILMRTESANGKKPLKFQDVTAELLTLCLDISDTGDATGLDGVCDERVPLFDSRLEYYFWQFDAHGRAHAQLYFYRVEPNS